MQCISNKISKLQKLWQRLTTLNVLQLCGEQRCFIYIKLFRYLKSKHELKTNTGSHFPRATYTYIPIPMSAYTNLQYSNVSMSFTSYILYFVILLLSLLYEAN